VDVIGRADRGAARRTAAALGLLVVLGGCSVSLPGTSTQGSGAVRTETRTVSGFSAIQLGGNGDVKIEQSGTESLTITAEENLLPLLTSDVVNNELRLGVKDGARIDTTQPITYTVTVKDLTGMEVAGSGTQMATKVKTASLRIRMAGSGSISATGTADAQDVQMAGSGTYRGSGLTSKTATVKSAGSGNAEIAVSDGLDVTIIGSGSVTYTGSPQIKQSILGSGSLQKK
jgi:Putative auto-transporter adhesin, head GIN domain